MKKNFLVAIIFSFSFQFCYAKVNPYFNLEIFAASTEDFHYSDFYLIKYDPRVAILDLINFDHKLSTFPLPEIPYNRKVQFGTWINIPGDQLCQNTRAKVLVRDSESPVTFSPNGCTVKSGTWSDPYTAANFDSASVIQIDHLVPLKNAYMTGAFEWNQDKRCLYANYLGNNFHLLSVSGTENMKKGDNTPMAYLPPNSAYKCEYMKHWLQVKVIWGLRITPKEAAAITKSFTDELCDRADFKMAAADLESQWRYMHDNMDLCTRAESHADLVIGF